MINTQVQYSGRFLLDALYFVTMLKATCIDFIEQLKLSYMAVGSIF